MKMKTISLLLSSLLLTIMCTAQIQYIPAAAHRFDVGIGGGVTTLFGDLPKKVLKPAACANFDYNFSPYFSIGLQGQIGSLAEGNRDIYSSSLGLYSETKFKAANINVRAALGLLLPKPENRLQDFIHNIYIGAGAGWVSSKIDNIVTTYATLNDQPISGTVTYETSELIIPVNAGVDMDLPVYGLGINLNLQYNFTRSEALDGYDFFIGANKHSDGYGMASISLKYYFGRMR